MADWKRMAKALILADGYIEEKKTEIIKKIILADGVVTKSEAEFLLDLRMNAAVAVESFHLFVFEVLKTAILADGTISPNEAIWLRRFILLDGEVDELEKAFLKDLQHSAKKTCPEFDELAKKYTER